MGRGAENFGVVRGGVGHKLEWRTGCPYKNQDRGSSFPVCADLKANMDVFPGLLGAENFWPCCFSVVY